MECWTSRPIYEASRAVYPLGVVEMLLKGFSLNAEANAEAGVETQLQQLLIWLQNCLVVEPPL